MLSIYSSTCCLVLINSEAVVILPILFFTYFLYLYSSTSISGPRFRLSIRKPRLCVVLAIQLLLLFRRSLSSSAMLLLNAINRHFWSFGISFIEEIAVLVLPAPAFASITAFPTPCCIKSKNFS